MKHTFEFPNFHILYIFLASLPIRLIDLVRKLDEQITPQKEISALHKRARDLLVESCLAVANFKIDEVCLGLHSRGGLLLFDVLNLFCVV